MAEGSIAIFIMTIMKILYSEGRPYFYDKGPKGLYCETECSYGKPSGHACIAISFTMIAFRVFEKNGIKNKLLIYVILFTAISSIFSRFYFG